MLLHAYEAEADSLASKIEPFGKNLALNTLKNKELSSWSSHRESFANIASLNMVRSLNPIPH